MFVKFNLNFCMFFEVFVNANESLIWVFMYSYSYILHMSFWMLSLGTLGLQPCWPPLLALGLKKIFINFLEFPIQIPCHLEEQFLSVCPLLFFLLSYNDGTFNTTYFPSLRSQEVRSSLKVPQGTQWLRFLQHWLQPFSSAALLGVSRMRLLPAFPKASHTEIQVCLLIYFYCLCLFLKSGDRTEQLWVRPLDPKSLSLGFYH